MNRKYSIEKINGNGPTYQIIEEQTQQICYILRQDDDLIAANKAKSNKWQKVGCLLAIPLIIVDLLSGGDLDFGDGGSDRVNQLSLFHPDGTKIMSYKRTWRGTKLFKNNKEVGQMRIKKRELICKYDLTYKGIFLGEIIPDSISHLTLKVEKKEQLVAAFVRKSAWTNNHVGRFQISYSTSDEEFMALMTIVFLWV